MRYRKNIECLTSDELHDLREAVAAMYALPGSDPNSFARLASFHGGPPTAYCRHGTPGFFTWHRAYLMAFENALANVGCSELPYWDWSSGPSRGVPEACRYPTYVNRSGATVANPLYSGPRSAGGQTARRPDIDTTAFDDLATSAQAAMSAATFTTFQNQIDGVHGGVHVRTGGDMGSVPTASYDPIFYFHHANVDRLWASWQASHPGALPVSEATFELQPFNRPFSIQWQRGSDMESIAALGYAYRRWCFFWPPFRLWEVVRIELPVVTRVQMESARILVKSTQMQRMPVEIRAFVDEPEANGQTETIGNPRFAAAAGFLGHGQARDVPTPEDCPECKRLGHSHDHPHGMERDHATGDDERLFHGGHGHDGNHGVTAPTERFDIELDITEAVHRAGDKEIALKIIAVDSDGKQVPASAMALEGIEVVID